MRNLLPSYIVEPYQRGISSGAFDAATLFIDISGFTAITEKLGEQGSEGAEILSSILNTIFEPAVDAVYKHELADLIASAQLKANLETHCAANVQFAHN